MTKTKGNLHKLHKQTVAQELQKQSYGIHFEPWETPLNLVWWQAYKPDILAIKQTRSSHRIVLVERETKPTCKTSFNQNKTDYKKPGNPKQLFADTMILPLLVIPPNNLQKMMFSPIRKFWEIWIISQEGQIKHKIPRTPASGSLGSFDW